MASRSVWKGYIRFSLVTIPVKAFTASASSTSSIALNQLHKDCGARVKYQKVCPTHGELKSEEIVSGYQYAENQYVIIEGQELETLRSKSDKSLGIEAFIPATAIDPRYYNGRTLYLIPDGPIGKKPFAMLQRLMQEEGRVAFATGVFSNRDAIMLLRPLKNLIAATFLSFEDEVKPTAEFEPQVPEAEIEAKELNLARSLVQQLAEDELDLSKYNDSYAKNLEALIAAKIEGKQTVTPPPEEEPQIINLMEALQKSIDEAKSKAVKKPAKVAAPSTAEKSAGKATKTPAKGKKKTG